MEIHRLQWRVSQAHFDSCFFPPSKHGLQGLGVGCQLGPRFFSYEKWEWPSICGCREGWMRQCPCRIKAQPSALCGNGDRDNDGSLSRAHERCPVRLPSSPGTLHFILFLLSLKRKNSPVGAGELTWQSRTQAAFQCFCFLFLFFHAYERFACVDICVPLMCLAPRKVGRECQCPGTGVVDACEPCGRWELTWGQWKGTTIPPAPSTSFFCSGSGFCSQQPHQVAYNSLKLQVRRSDALFWLSRTLHTCGARQRSRQSINIHKLKVKNKKPHSQIGFGRKWDHSGSRSWRQQLSTVGTLTRALPSN